MAGETPEPEVVAPATGAVPLEKPAVEAAVAEAAPVVEAAPAVEAAVAEVAPAAEAAATVADTPSLIEDAKLEEKPAEAKEGEPAKAAEEKPAEEKPTDAPKAEEKPKEAEKAPEAEKPAAEAAKPAELAPVEYKYELPEGVLKMDDGQRTEFHGVLDSLRRDPGNIQPLVDLHVKHVNTLVDHLGQEQHRLFNDTRKQWRDQIKGDEEFGGAGFDTATKAVARMRDLLVSSHPVGSPEYDRDAKAANEFFRITGAGDHPVLWRMLHNAARFFDEAPMPPANIAPAPGGKAPNGSRRSVMYDNPTSPNNRS